MSEVYKGFTGTLMQLYDFEATPPVAGEVLRYAQSPNSC